MLNQTFLMSSLSASLFYKEINQLQPIIDKVFQFRKFNSLCNGFVRLGRYSELLNQIEILELQKGSGKKWTSVRDFDQLNKFGREPNDEYEVIRIVGKNPFLWNDHWPIKDYAKIFECLVCVHVFAKEADRVVSKIRAVGIVSTDKQLSSEEGAGGNGDISKLQVMPYMAVHDSLALTLVDWALRLHILWDLKRERVKRQQ